MWFIVFGLVALFVVGWVGDLVLVDYADCAGFAWVCGGDLLCWWFAIWCGLRFVGGVNCGGWLLFIGLGLGRLV